MDACERLLLRDSVPVSLQPKAFDTLLVLVENGGRLVEKDALMQAVWPDSFVEEVNLSANISLLRKALGEKQNGHKYIETVPKHGYRFVAPVREISQETPTTILQADRKNDSPEIVAEEKREEIATDATLPTPYVQPPTHEQRDAPVEIKRASETSRRMILAGLLLLSGISAAALSYYSRHENTDTISTAAPIAGSLAVLPFQSLNPESDDQYLCVGIADTLITKLSNLRQLTVRPTSAVLRYAGNVGDAERDAMAAGRALQVEAILEGSIHRLGDRVRITVRLVGVRDDATVWAETFDEPFTDLLAVQDSISERVARALVLNLSREDRLQLTKRYTENAEAYRLYLMGRYIWNRRFDGVFRSREYFQQAIALDPNFALAYVGLADSYSMGAPPPEAERAVKRALEIDDQLGEAHATRGFIQMFHHWDWASAEQEFERAIELNPNYATAHHWRGVYLSIRGRLDEAKQEMRRALEIDPTSLIINSDLGQLHYFARDYDAAIAQCRRVLEMDASFRMAHQYLYFTYIKKGMGDEAFREQLVITGISNATEEARQRRLFAASGMRGLWQKSVNQARMQPQPDAYSVASLYALLGNKDESLHWLDRAYREHAFLLPFINTDPLFDDLRTDPRFQDLLRRIGLA